MALMYGGTFLGGGRRVRRGGALGDEDTPTAKKKYVITKKPSKKQIENLAQLQRQIDVEDAEAQAQEAPKITPTERARLMRDALGIKPKKPRAKPTPESRQKRADAKIRRETRLARKQAIEMYDAMTPEEQEAMSEDQYQEIRNEIYKDKTEKGLNLRNRILGHSGYTDSKGRVLKPTKGYTGDSVRMSDADKNDLSRWLYERGYGNGGAILSGGSILQEGGVPLGGRRRGGVPLGGVPLGGRRRGGQPLGGQPLGGQPLGGQPLGGVFMGGRRRGGVPMGGAWYDDLWDGIKSVASTVLPILL